MADALKNRALKDERRFSLPDRRGWKTFARLRVLAALTNAQGRAMLEWDRRRHSCAAPMGGAVRPGNIAHVVADAVGLVRARRHARRRRSCRRSAPARNARPPRPHLGKRASM